MSDVINDMLRAFQNQYTIVKTSEFVSYHLKFGFNTLSQH